MLRGAALTVGAGALAGGGYVYADPGLRRSCRFWGRAGPIVGHYVATDVWHRLVRGAPASEQQAAFAALHERYADRVLDTIQDLRGIFIKLGQVMSTRPELVPEAYRKRLQALQSGAPSEPLNVIERVIEQEFGRPAHELFSHIEAEPCGAASIGQAHIATLRVDGGGDADGVGGGEGEGGADGRQVVVKVQYPDAEAMFLADIQSIVLLSSTFYPESAPFMKEFANQFTMELDFKRERRNIEEIGLAVTPTFSDRVVIPEVVASHSGRRVLTMTHIPGNSLEVHATRLLEEAGLGGFMTAGRVTEIIRKSGGGGGGGGGGGQHNERDGGDSSGVGEGGGESVSAAPDIGEGETATALGTRSTGDTGGRKGGEAVGGIAGGMVGTLGGGAGQGGGRGGGRGGWTNRLLRFVGVDTAMSLWRAGLLARRAWTEVWVGFVESLVSVGAVRSDGSWGEWSVKARLKLDASRATRFTARWVQTLLDVHGYEIFEAAFFNGDPHPGNILVMPDNRLGLIDYGQCKRLPPASRDEIATLMCAVADGASDAALADIFRGMGMKTKNDDTWFMGSFARLIFGQLTSDQIDPSWHRRLHTTDQIVAFPPDLLMVARVAGLLRGIGFALRQNVNVAEAWQGRARAHAG